jgi:hypothetical protein
MSANTQQFQACEGNLCRHTWHLLAICRTPTSSWCPLLTLCAHPWQVVLERSFKQQQDKVEAEQVQLAGTTARLAAAVAHKKVNMDAAGLPLYQSVFSQIVDYVSAAAGLQAKVASDPEARAQVSAAVESVLPLSSLAYFLTLPAQERMQQVRCPLTGHPSTADGTAGIGRVLPQNMAYQQRQQQHKTAPCGPYHSSTAHVSTAPALRTGRVSQTRLGLGDPPRPSSSWRHTQAASS